MENLKEKQKKKSLLLCCFCFDKKSAIFVISALAIFHSAVNITLATKVSAESAIFYPSRISIINQSWSQNPISLIILISLRPLKFFTFDSWIGDPAPHCSAHREIWYPIPNNQRIIIAEKALCFAQLSNFLNLLFYSRMFKSFYSFYRLSRRIPHTTFTSLPSPSKRMTRHLTYKTFLRNWR